MESQKEFIKNLKEMLGNEGYKEYSQIPHKFLDKSIEKIDESLEMIHMVELYYLTTACTKQDGSKQYQSLKLRCNLMENASNLLGGAVDEIKKTKLIDMV